jgi:hypothetical protein
MKIGFIIQRVGGMLLKNQKQSLHIAEMFIPKIKLEATKKYIALKPLQVIKDFKLWRSQELGLKVGLALVAQVETIVVSWNWIQVEVMLKDSIEFVILRIKECLKHSYQQNAYGVTTLP